MTSIMAPRIDADLPATPAHEWANETSSRLEETTTIPATTTTPAAMTTPEASTRPAMSTSPSTPGVSVPGSYPGGDEAGHNGILDMAKQYQKDVQGVFMNASESAKQYLPTSVAAYLPDSGPGSLPSQEGAQRPFERSDGVGSLPGTASETSVAKLPDERTSARPLEHSDGIVGTTSANGTSRESRLDTSKPLPSLTPATDGGLPSDTVSNASVEAQPPSVQTPKLTSGVGDLPGGKDESRVALLPDERKTEEQAKHDAQSPEPVVNLTARRHPIGGLGSDREYNTAASGHEHESLPLPSAPNGSRFTETNKGDQSESPTKKHVEEGDGGGTPRKPKLMDKLKGEVKVLTGKLGGKEDKVEEGRRLMGKAV